jgi:XXXCH domain-containing protein
VKGKGADGSGAGGSGADGAGAGEKGAGAEGPAAAKSASFASPAKPANTVRPARSAKVDDARERTREKYRQLKKLLQADYKALQKAAAAGQLPPQDVLESFLALGETMAEAPQPAQQVGAGPEAKELAQANAAYLEDARQLRRAFSARDAAAFAEILARLERRKSACHAQFK